MAVSMVALSGCVGVGVPRVTKGATVDPLVVRKDYYASLDAVQALVPATGQWKNEDETVGEYCSMPDGSEGVNWYGSRVGSPLSQEDQEKASRDVSKYLKGRGLKVQVLRSGGAVPEIQTNGFGENFLTIGVHSTDKATTITGYSQCAPDPDAKYH